MEALFCKFSHIFVCLPFCNIIMTGESKHTTLEWEKILSDILVCLNARPTEIVKRSLRCYVQPITQSYK